MMILEIIIVLMHSGELLNQQFNYLYEKDDFIYKVNDYIIKYTQSFIDLTTLRSNLGDVVYFDYTLNSMNTYFSTINYLINYDKITSCNKQLIVEGVLYNLILENFTFEHHKSVKELLSSNIDKCKLKLYEKNDLKMYFYRMYF